MKNRSLKHLGFIRLLLNLLYYKKSNTNWAVTAKPASLPQQNACECIHLTVTDINADEY